MTIKRFEDLIVWQKARAFRKKIYDITRKLPQEERFQLLTNIRDAACSITRNIAEGFGRYHLQENIQFCRMARGSLNEVLDDLYLCLDEEYIPEQAFKETYQQGREVEQLFNGYIKSMKRKRVSMGKKIGGTKEPLTTYNLPHTTSEIRDEGAEFP